MGPCLCPNPRAAWGGRLAFPGQGDWRWKGPPGDLQASWQRGNEKWTDYIRRKSGNKAAEETGVRGDHQGW